MSGKEHDEMPKHVTAEVNVEALKKNLEGNGMHHVFGEDGTQFVIREREGDTSDVTVQPKFQIVAEDGKPRRVLDRLLKYSAEDTNTI
ncbi:hypothetical protein [Halorussus salinus]|uniref:hypothetical protein n=1 Tax=Halorussus salinus TaxID=1364935 RepID=UPI0010933311|nr:hypothetical protein [Halorussus salinus]